MPIPVLSFPYKTLEQTNPEIYAGAAGADLLSKAIANQRAIAESRYVEPELSEKLSQLRAETEIKNHTAQYTPQMLQAELQKKILESPKMQADIDNIYRNQIPLGQAHTNYYNTQTSLMPGDAAYDRALKGAHANYYNTQSKQAPLEQELREKMFEWKKNKLNNPNIMQLGRFVSSLPVEQRMLWLSEHPEYEDLITQATQRVAGNSPAISSSGEGLGLGLGQGSGAGTSDVQQLADKLGVSLYKNPKTEEVIDYSKQQVPASANKEDMLPAIKEANALQSMSPIKLDDFERSRLSRKLAANNKLNDKTENQRAAAAIIMESWLHENKADYAKRIANATSYASVKGQSKKLADAFAHSNPEAYEDYLWLKDNFAPNIGNQIRMMEKAPGVKTVTEKLDKMVNTSAWDRTPQQAVNLSNQILHDMGSLANTVIKNSEKAYPGVRRKLAGIPEFDPNEKYVSQEVIDKVHGSKNPSVLKFDLSEKNIKAVAERHGMTTDEVREYIKRKGLK